MEKNQYKLDQVDTLTTLLILDPGPCLPKELEQISLSDVVPVSIHQNTRGLRK